MRWHQFVNYLLMGAGSNAKSEPMASAVFHLALLRGPNYESTRLDSAGKPLIILIPVPVQLEFLCHAPAEYITCIYESAERTKPRS